MDLTSKRNANRVVITPHPEWAQRFWDELTTYKDRVVEHIYFKELAQGTLSIERARKGLIDFYPLVENFPKYMALNMAKTNGRRIDSHRLTKSWLLQNMKVEQKHADWWCDWAECIHLDRKMLDQAQPSALMDAINHFLWNINTYGSLAEGLAATNLAIEWATGEWTVRIIQGVTSYSQQGLAVINQKTMAWLKAHAAYDDLHPYEAMELIKKVATNAELQQAALRAAKRAMDYYLIALDDCYQSYPGLTDHMAAEREQQLLVH
jgi:pyrroloquinoline quinone (PQQ) biosynthesis protein C